VSQPAPASAAQDSERQLIEKDREIKRKVRAWRWTLSQISKREKATMFFDVPLDRTPPNIAYDRPFGARTMTAIADSADRRWKQINGIQTFARSQTRKSQEEVTEALKWLATLPDDQFNRLYAGKSTLADLDPQTQDLMRGLAGWEPDMSFALLGKSDATQVRLIVGPKFSYTDPKTGAAKQMTIPMGLKPADPKPNPGVGRAPEAQPLDKPTDGPLKFNEGEILQLSEIAARAADAFHVAYAVDARIAENRYFISGSYTKTDFEAVLEKVTTVPPVRVRPPHPDHASELALLRSRILGTDHGTVDVSILRGGIRFKGSEDLGAFNQKYGATEELSATDFLQQKSMMASDLCQGKPGLALFFERIGVAPNTMLSLDANFGLGFQTSGIHVASRGSATIDGQPAPLYGPNEIMIGLQ
jgi:hypothetical protein